MGRFLIGASITVVVLIMLVTIALILQGVKSRKGKPLGLDGAQLHACPASPNCQNSEYIEDTEHYTDPIILNDSQLQPWAQAERAISKMGGRVTARSETYLAAEFQSKLLGFVDDFELRLDVNENLLHIRSASRVGHSDLGKNLNRVAEFRKAFAEG